MVRQCWYEGNLWIFEGMLKELAENNGMTWRKCSTFHYHLKGVFLVNIYPTAGSFYIQGSNGKGYFYKVEELASIANGKSDKHMNTIEKGVRKYGKSRKKRMKMWEREDNRICFVCRQPIENFEDCNLEHKVPLSKGGSNRMDNLSLSHYKCNDARGNKMGIKENTNAK